MLPQDITVCLVDDDDAISDALSKSLQVRGFLVEKYRSAVQFLSEYQPGVDLRERCLVLDKSMPAMSGLELQAELIKRGHDFPIIFITGDGTISDTVQALKAGASDFIEKPFTPDVLQQSIVVAVLEYKQRKQRGKRANEIKKKISTLTVREHDVLNQLLESDAEVPSNKVIARSLDISHRTVEHHRASIMMKTGVASIYELKALMEIAESIF